MQVHRNIQHLPELVRPVLTIGTFDGVHVGHRQIIRKLVDEARAIEGQSVLLTFHPHPRQIVRKDSGIALLNTPEERSRLLDSLGVDHLVVIPFTQAFSEMSAEEYVRDFLVRVFHPEKIIIGYDHRFGRGRSGDYRLLEKLGETYRYVVEEIPEKWIEDTIVSSTKIREALLQGDLQTATQYLGYPYFFTGKVVRGNQLGRTLGYPTANLSPEATEKLIPAHGVYAVTCTLESRPGKTWKGMMNIGVRPTVDGLNRMIEVNLFDFEEDIYDQHLTVTLHARIRAEEKFPGLDALKAQLSLDRKNAELLLGQL